MRAQNLLAGAAVVALEAGPAEGLDPDARAEREGSGGVRAEGDERAGAFVAGDEREFGWERPCDSKEVSET